MIRPVDVHRFCRPAGALDAGKGQQLTGRFGGAGQRTGVIVVTVNEARRRTGAAAGEPASAPASRMKTGAARPRPEAGRRKPRP